MRKIASGVLLLLSVAVLSGPAGSQFAMAQKKKDKETTTAEKDKEATTAKEKTTTTGVAAFQLYTDKAGEFRFRLNDEQGVLLANSTKGYKTKSECENVVEAVKKAAAKAKIDDQTKPVAKTPTKAPMKK